MPHWRRLRMNRKNSVRLEHLNMLHHSKEVLALAVPREIKVLFYTTMTIVASILILLFVCPVNDVAKVKGVVRTEMNNSSVRNVIPGKIKRLFYRPEQYVEKGDLLYVLDDEVYKALREDLVIEIQDAQDWLLCLDKVLESCRLNKNLLTETDTLSYAKVQEYFTNIRYLESQLEVAEYRLKLAQEQPQALRLDTSINEALLNRTLAQDELNRYKAAFYSSAMEQHKQYTKQYEKLQQELIRTDGQYEFLEVKAPVSGFVQELSSLNEGDYIFADQVVLNIIPSDSENFRIELSVPTKDVGELKEGMTVKYRLSAFPFFEYRGAEGRLTSIDPDVRQGEKGELYYCVYSDIDRTIFKNYRGNEYKMRSGMEVDARIILEKTTVAFYILRKLDFIAG